MPNAIDDAVSILYKTHHDASHRRHDAPSVPLSEKTLQTIRPDEPRSSVLGEA